MSLSSMENYLLSAVGPECVQLPSLVLLHEVGFQIVDPIECCLRLGQKIPELGAKGIQLLAEILCILEKLMKQLQHL